LKFASVVVGAASKPSRALLGWTAEAAVPTRASRLRLVLTASA